MANRSPSTGRASPVIPAITYAKLQFEVCRGANALTEPPTCMRYTGRAGLGDLVR